MREAVEWNPENPVQLENLLDEVEDIRPEGRSPIADAMVLAARQDLANATSPKSLLVLTDGEDNESGEWANLADYLQREFNDKDIFVNVVLYQVPDAAEEERAQKQFAAVETLRPEPAGCSGQPTPTACRSSWTRP